MRHSGLLSTVFPSSPSLSLVPLLGGILLTAMGCSSTQTVTNHSDGYSRVTEAVARETVTVHFRDGRTLKLKNLYVGPEVTTGVVPAGQEEERSFPTSDIWRITAVDRGTGFLQGAGLGGVGPLGGGLLAQLQGDGLGADLMTVAGLVLSVPSALVGGIIGAIRGHRTTYLIDAPSPATDSATGTSRFRISKKMSHK